MPTETTGPEPGPTGFTPYPYPSGSVARVGGQVVPVAVGCAAHDGMHPVGSCELSSPAPPEPDSHDQNCPGYASSFDYCPECGWRDAAAGQPSTLSTSVHEAALAAVREQLPNRDSYRTWDRNLLAYKIASAVADRVLAAIPASEPAPLPTRAEVLQVAEASIAGRAFGCGEAAKVIDALHAAGLLPWREET